MGKFILIDFRKREEIASLQKLVPQICVKMDQWIKNYDCGVDGTPPNADEAAKLEDEQMATLLSEFDESAGKLSRAKDKVPDRRALLERNLNRRKGNLFIKYSFQVEDLQNQAASTMKYCGETFEDFEQGLKNVMPTVESDIEIIFTNMMDNCKSYIEASFPGGVSGMDSFDDGMPDGVLSFSQFQEMVGKKKEEYLAKNQEAIGPTVEKVKLDSKKMFQTKINEAIREAVKAIEEDLSDDVLPYLDKEAMSALRQELVASAKEYGESRVDNAE
jgi:hypothetical protein